MKTDRRVADRSIKYSPGQNDPVWTHLNVPTKMNVLWIKVIYSLYKYFIKDYTLTLYLHNFNITSSESIKHEIHRKISRIFFVTRINFIYGQLNSWKTLDRRKTNARKSRSSKGKSFFFVPFFSGLWIFFFILVSSLMEVLSHLGLLLLKNLAWRLSRIASSRRWVIWITRARPT